MKSTNPISNFPKMHKGNRTIDNGNLLFTDEEYKNIISKYPDSKQLFKNILGAKDLLYVIRRWCLWIEDNDLEFAKSFDFIKNRIDKVKTFRLNSSRKGTQNAANKLHQFREMKKAKIRSIVIPEVSSSKRKYIPIGRINKNTIIDASCAVIYDPEPYIFGIVTSYMHMLWTKTLGGRLGVIRYSPNLCYNTFPFPEITEEQKNNIENRALVILDERERHPDKSLAELYDDNKMPIGLKEAHNKLDLVIESCYRSKPFTSDEERFDHLCKLYKKMVEENDS